MTGDDITPPGAPAWPADTAKPASRYIRKAAGMLRSAAAQRGQFTVAGKLALLLAEQRTPKDERGAWKSDELRDNIARALAEIDGLVQSAALGSEAASERIRQAAEPPPQREHQQEGPPPWDDDHLAVLKRAAQRSDKPAQIKLCCGSHAQARRTAGGGAGRSGTPERPGPPIAISFDTELWRGIVNQLGAVHVRRLSFSLWSSSSIRPNCRRELTNLGRNEGQTSHDNSRNLASHGSWQGLCDVQSTSRSAIAS